MALNFTDILADRATEIQQALQTLLPPKDHNQLAPALRYAVLNGGKRLRGYLVCESAQLFDAPKGGAMRAAAAIECMHAYSLVHDDLPCMDDDDLRRGKPTVHVKWDEATAVLVGDALQSLAFDILSDPQTALDPNIRLMLVHQLAHAAGAQGMVLGQAQDIAAETAATPLDLAAITELQSNKTGALIIWSARAGAILGDGPPDVMSKYARALGMAFQIRDDILDVEGNAADTGKRVNKDAQAGKATFVSLLGLDGARTRAADLVQQACDVLSPYGDKAGNLRQLAQFVIAREM